MLPKQDSAKRVQPRPSRLRVLHVSSGDLWAGAEVQLHQLLRCLAQRDDLETSVILLNEGILAERLRAEGIRVTVISETSTSGLTLFLSLIRVIRESRPHIVHTHRVKENLLGALAARLCGVIASVRTVHGQWEIAPTGILMRARQSALRQIDILVGRYLQSAVVAVSAQLADELKKYYPSSHVHTISNGIDVEDVIQRASTPDGICLGERRGICAVGRLVAVKRIDVFLRAAKIVLEMRPGQYAFYVVGDGPLRGELELLAKSLGIAEDVRFTGFSENPLPVLRQMALEVITSDHEGTPMIALESVALGVPVLAHAVGGLISLISSPDIGRLIYSQDPHDVAEQIIAMTASDRSAVNRNSAGRLPEEFTVQRSAQCYGNLYRELARRPPLETGSA